MELIIILVLAIMLASGIPYIFKSSSTMKREKEEIKAKKKAKDIKQQLYDEDKYDNNYHKRHS